MDLGISHGPFSIGFQDQGFAFASGDGHGGGDGAARTHGCPVKIGASWILLRLFLRRLCVSVLQLPVFPMILRQFLTWTQISSSVAARAVVGGGVPSAIFAASCIHVRSVL